MVAARARQGATWLAPRLPEDLRRRIARNIRWQADTVTAPLVADEQVDASDVAEVIGTRQEDGDRDIGVFLTDLPSRAERNPVRTEVDPERRVALISLHGLGSRRLRRRSGAAGGGRRRQATDRAGRRAAGFRSRRPSAPGSGRSANATRCQGLPGHVRPAVAAVAPSILAATLSAPAS
ncbi:hypothetical protein [Kitasatospora sp. NPDC051914]|uniref:hypothetical protein n=1 Tax=Kitasatospora sp. NPDC051914 TaxID=3154945 RepID=UPI00341B69EF